MKTFLARTVRGLCAVAALCLAVHTAGAQTTATGIAAAANKFLSTLDQAQRRTVLFSFDDDEQRTRWSNLPVTSVRRAGLSLGEMSEPQRAAAFALLSQR